MKIYFQKGVNQRYKNRWYMFGRAGEAPQWHHGIYNWGTAFPISFVSSWDCREIESKLRAAGFNPIRDQKWCGDPIEIFLYFRSHADEAHFMLWASNDVDLETI